MQNKLSILLIIIILTSSITINSVPLTLCDKRYAIEMQRSLEDIKPKLNIDLMSTAESYMIKVKQHRDLNYLIRKIEQNEFSNTVTAILRRPLNLYITCENSIEYGTINRLTRVHNDHSDESLSKSSPLTTCDRTYESEMKRVLAEDLGNLIIPNVDNVYNLAKSYMIMLKKYNDLNMEIEEMDRKTFSSQITAFLRRPLLMIERCEEALTTKIVNNNMRSHY